MFPRPTGKNLPPEASESDVMAPNNAGRSPSASARCCLKRTLGTMMALGMLVLLPILGVGAFSGRHGCTPGSGLWASYFGGRHAAGDAGKCLESADRLPNQRTERSGDRTGEGIKVFGWLSFRSIRPTSISASASTDEGDAEISWFRAESSEVFSKDLSEDFSGDFSEEFSEDVSPSDVSESDALRLASSARGGGGRGFWFPGQRSRRRRNAARMEQRAAAKRGGLGAGGGDLPKGLANQGNTCYLNSLLQTLYHTPGLKEAVEEAVSEGGCGKAGAASALATVFRQLGEGSRPGSTTALTKAMGLDPRVQQDAQEFGRFLFMALEGDCRVPRKEQAGGERGGLPGAINGLFAGRLVNYIECVNVPHSKEVEEVFYDLSLDVKGSETLQESLHRFTEAELMTGENRWRAGDHSLQEARKGVRFVELPPVLQFHLKRFEYDPYRDDLAKINDRFEFPTELDMSPWLKAPPSPPSAAGAANAVAAAASGSASTQQRSQRYHLSAVVMHVGGPSAGHYYAYVRYITKPPLSMSSPPSGSTELGTEAGGTKLPQQDAAKQDAKWVKLDDQRVTEVSEAEVLRDAFGGSGGVYGGPAASGVAGFQGLLGMAGGGGGSGGTSSAYMLQYVRDEDAMLPEPTASLGSLADQGSERAQP